MSEVKAPERIVVTYWTCSDASPSVRPGQRSDRQTGLAGDTDYERSDLVDALRAELAVSVKAGVDQGDELAAARAEADSWRVLAEKIDDAETQCSSMVSARDLTIRDLRAQLATLRETHYEGPPDIELDAAKAKLQHWCPVVPLHDEDGTVDVQDRDDGHSHHYVPSSKLAAARAEVEAAKDDVRGRIRDYEHDIAELRASIQELMPLRAQLAEQTDIATLAIGECNRAQAQLAEREVELADAGRALGQVCVIASLHGDEELLGPIDHAAVTAAMEMHAALAAAEAKRHRCPHGRCIECVALAAPPPVERCKRCGDELPHLSELHAVRCQKLPAAPELAENNVTKGTDHDYQDRPQHAHTPGCDNSIRGSSGGGSPPPSPAQPGPEGHRTGRARPGGDGPQPSVERGTSRAGVAPELAEKGGAKADPSVKDPYFVTGCRCVIIANDNTAGTYCPVHGDQG